MKQLINRIKNKLEQLLISHDAEHHEKLRGQQVNKLKVYNLIGCPPCCND